MVCVFGLVIRELPQLFDFERLKQNPVSPVGTTGNKNDVMAAVLFFTETIQPDPPAFANHSDQCKHASQTHSVFFPVVSSVDRTTNQPEPVTGSQNRSG